MKGEFISLKTAKKIADLENEVKRLNEVLNDIEDVVSETQNFTFYGCWIRVKNILYKNKIRGDKK